MAPELLLPDWPAPPTVRALQTTRRGGVSRAPYESFNLGDHVGDAIDAVGANRALLRRSLPNEPVWLRQVHGTVVVDAGRVPSGIEADAALARGPGAVCAVMTADCLPVLLCDRRGTVVAAVHAGWRGLCGGVIEATVAAMAVPANDLMAWLGPAIGPAAFEVGDEVRTAFLVADAAAGEAFVPHGPGKWLADIYLLARQRLAGVGIVDIWGGGACTVSDPQRYFSYRRDGVTGRMATLVWLDKAQ